MLEVKNLHATIAGKEILRGINLTIKDGEIHAIMGPNGSGKSTLSAVLTGNPLYEVTEGEAWFNGKNLIEMKPEDRANEGLFLSFQYPVEIPGVSMTNFLKAAVNEKRKYQGLPELKAGDKLYVTKNDSSVYAFRIGRQPIADKGFHMICAHSDSPTFRVKPNAEMLTEGGMVRLNTEVYGGPIMSTWMDRPLTLAGRVIVRGEDVMAPETMLIHVKRPLLQITNLAIHFNRQVNDGVKLSKQKDM